MKFSNFRQAYLSLVGNVSSLGLPASPRGHKVRELQEPSVWTIQSPQDWALPIPGRRLNIFFALAEVVWMWSGRGGVEFIKFYNKSIAQFQDGDLPYFNGAYGLRARKFGINEAEHRPWLPWVTRYPQAPDGSWGVFTGQEDVVIDQLQCVIEKLAEDPHSRQAVICLWDPVKDNIVKGSKDYPCNNLVYCQIRDGALKFTVVMRSNDVVLGTPYNMIQFSHLQALLAGSLGVEQGPYSVVANNLHMYEDSYYPEAVRDIFSCGCPKVDWSVGGTDPGAIWDMRWTITQFSQFVETVWVPIEAALRAQHVAGNLTEHDLLTTIENLGLAYEDQGVPAYWRELFHMLLVWHIRKAGKQQDHFQDTAHDFTSSILDSVNPVFKFLAGDFDPTLV